MFKIKERIEKYGMKLWDRFPIGIIKTKSGINKIKKACKITDEIFNHIVSNFNFKTELELRDFIISQIKLKKVKPSFPPIVTSGERAGNEIHPQSTDNRLSGFTIIDFGVSYKGFCSDMTRTIFIGELSDQDKEIYKKILDSEELGIKNSVIGEKCSDLDKKVRDSLGEEAKYFIHTLGHGVGRFIHEPPLIFYKRDRHILKENMVITIEPGIYIKNKLGIRIEDTCLITKKGCISLTKSPKHLIMVR